MLKIQWLQFKQHVFYILKFFWKYITLWIFTTVCNQAKKIKKKCPFVIAPSHGLFSTCRGEKIFTVLIQQCTVHYVNERVFECNIFTWGFGFDACMQIPVCSGPMLQVNCLILHSAGLTPLLTHPSDPSLWLHPINPAHICDTQFSLAN